MPHFADLTAWEEFRRGENQPEPKLICCICGKPAEGNASFIGTDEEICDACVAEDEATNVDGKKIKLGE
mgnify:CR=1 FL=1